MAGDCAGAGAARGPDHSDVRLLLANAWCSCCGDATPCEVTPVKDDRSDSAQSCRRQSLINARYSPRVCTFETSQITQMHGSYSGCAVAMSPSIPNKRTLLVHLRNSPGDSDVRLIARACDRLLFNSPDQ